MFVVGAVAVAARAAPGALLDRHGVVEEVAVVLLGGEVVVHVEGLGQDPVVFEQAVFVEVVVDLAVRGRVPCWGCGRVDTGVAGSLGVVAQSVVEHMYQLRGGLLDGERFQQVGVGVDAPLLVDADPRGSVGGDDWA